ncbi:MAG: DinB family protein [Chloroflexota bacterium]|nr:DinB family protein [Chloroflexota bacterium]
MSIQTNDYGKQIEQGARIMDAVKSKRANALADRIEQGTGALAAFAEGLSDVEWQVIVPGEERSIGVLVHHIASMYPVEIDLARQLAVGKPITGVTWDAVDQMNAEHAREHTEVEKQETIALLWKNSRAAAERVRAFTDEELDQAATVSLNADAPLTAQFFIEDHALRHSFHHLAEMRATLNR